MTREKAPAARASRRALLLTSRALLRHCPNCGGHPIFASWLRMAPTCPRCGLILERRESGYLVGAYMFNMIAAELAFAALFVAVVLWTWPAVPWTPLIYGSAVLMVLLPVLFYPYSKTLFLAFDLVFRPAGYEASELPSHPPQPASLDQKPAKRP